MRDRPQSPTSSQLLLQLPRKKTWMRVSLDEWEDGGTSVSFSVWCRGKDDRLFCLKGVSLSLDEVPKVIEALRGATP